MANAKYLTDIWKIAMKSERKGEELHMGANPWKKVCETVLVKDTVSAKESTNNMIEATL